MLRKRNISQLTANYKVKGFHEEAFYFFDTSESLRNSCRRPTQAF